MVRTCEVRQRGVKKEVKFDSSHNDHLDVATLMEEHYPEYSGLFYVTNVNNYVNTFLSLSMVATKDISNKWKPAKGYEAGCDENCYL